MFNTHACKNTYIYIYVWTEHFESMPNTNALKTEERMISQQWGSNLRKYDVQTSVDLNLGHSIYQFSYSTPSVYIDIAEILTACIL